MCLNSWVKQSGRMEALRLAEWDLKSNPYDYPMLYSYSGNCRQAGGRSSSSRMGFRAAPSSIDWHRIYQELNRESESGNQAMISAYDAMLQKEPENSALLYLRGRL